jgi:hypothetical protein
MHDTRKKQTRVALTGVSLQTLIADPTFLLYATGCPARIVGEIVQAPAMLRKL